MPIPERFAGDSRDDHLADSNAVRRLYNMMTPATDYGLATNKTAAQNAAALQAQINANNGLILLPKGTYQVGPLALSGNCGTIIGAGWDKTILVCPDGDLFGVPGTITGWRFANFRATAQAGDVFSGGFVACIFEALDLYASDADGHIAYHDSSDGQSSYLENVWLNCRAQVTPTHNVPAFYLRGMNAVNLNQWIGGRYTYSGDYVFHLEGVSDQSFLSNNSFRGINFEVTTGGNIRLLSCLGTVIESCGTYDTHLLGPIQKTLYSVGAGVGTLTSRFTTFCNNLRHGGSLAEGVHDIDAFGQQNTTLINNGTTVSGYSTRLMATGTFAINDQGVGASKIGLTAPDGTLWAVGVSNAGALEVGAV